ncbi:MAG: DedA family protein [Armatimonadetes bacterium]|nr:DedA family protein [Armatimonadota bacterium]
MGILEAIKLWCEHVISTLGYPGIIFLTALSCCNIPIPSEVVSIFSGILAQENQLNFHAAALTATLGCLVGSAASYKLGSALGPQGLQKYGRYLLMRPAEIAHAEVWFNKYGLNLTLWGRFVPFVRSVVSFPAGIYRADFKRFMVYAFLGSLPWCYAWTAVGFFLGSRWKEVEKYGKIVDGLVLLVLVALIARWLLKRRARNHVHEATPQESATN